MTLTALAAQLEGMASEVRALFPADASNLMRFKVLRDYLYRPPPDSGRKPFLYNFVLQLEASLHALQNAENTFGGYTTIVKVLSRI